MMRTFVVPDLHGNHALARQLLEQAGVPLNPTARRAAEIRAVQLGDAGNCVASSRVDDVATLDAARDWFDVVLVGNHEYPYLNPRGGFDGFAPYGDVFAALERLRRDGKLRPCLLVGGTLLTHAGVALWLGRPTAAETADALERRWKHEPGAAEFARVGSARGGYDEGGALWSDWSESRAPFDQVHGHTPTPDGPALRVTPDGHLLVNLDVGCGKGADRLVGAWLDERGEVSALAPFVEVRAAVAA